MSTCFFINYFFGNLDRLNRILETAHTATMIGLVYSLVVTNYGNERAILSPSIFIALVFPLSSVIGAIVNVSLYTYTCLLHAYNYHTVLLRL
jgi:hypothetical protein